MPTPKILVTGGAGFIGSHLAEKLVTTGWKVSVVDDLSIGKIENLQDQIGSGKVQFVKGDIRDGKSMTKLVKGFDAVAHMAAIASVSFSIKNPVLANDVNANGTLNLLKACSDAGVKRFVLASSCAVYGEPHYLPIDEEHSTIPISPYAVSKLAAEHYCQVFHKVYGLETVVLRLFNVYGSRQNSAGEGGVVAKFAECLRSESPLTIYGNGSQTRDFVHVNDVVEAFILALKKPRLGGCVFNVGSGIPTSVRTLTELMLGLAGSNFGVINGTPRAGDIVHSFANVEKAEKMLGYAPKTTLQEGLKSLIKNGAENSNIRRRSNPINRGTQPKLGVTGKPRCSA